MRYAGLNTTDIANGPGVRVSVFVSGCRNACPGCFNAEAQDFGFGIPFTQDSINQIKGALDRPEIAGLTVLGGEPLEPENQHMVLRLVQTAKLLRPKKSVWLYTGLTYEDLASGTSRVETEYLKWILECTDVLVDGPFVEDKRDLTLAFRGSSNQRLIDLSAMREAHDMSTIITYDVM